MNNRDKKKAILFHNPEAGDEDVTRKDIVSAIEGGGYDCEYVSVKKPGWDEAFDATNKDGNSKTDLLILAGGDGTIRKVVKKILKRKDLTYTTPIAILPQGTANNIAATLGISGTVKEIVSSWKNTEVKLFDVGRVENLDGENFFLEGLGFGVFPYLMNEMEKKENKEIEPAEKKNAYGVGNSIPYITLV